MCHHAADGRTHQYAHGRAGKNAYKWCQDDIQACFSCDQACQFYSHISGNKGTERFTGACQDHRAVLDKYGAGSDLACETTYHTCSGGREHNQRGFLKTAGHSNTDSGACHGSCHLAELIQQSPHVSANEISYLLDDRADDQCGKKSGSHTAQTVHENPVQ